MEEKESMVTFAETAESAEIEGEAVASAEQEEITEAAWQGADTADKLSYAAMLYGMPEDALVEGLLRQSGDDGERWAAHVQQRRRAEDDGLAERLAAEFEELTAQVPDIRQVEDLPDEVVRTAMTEGVTLTDAYLRYWYGRARQAAAQQERQRLAAEQSAGSLSDVFDEPDPRGTAFSRSFRTALS